jgi:hypothetical protein
MNYITGERIQALADVSFAIERNSIISAQLRNTKLNIFFASETPIETLTDIFNKKTIIFVYTHFLDFFFAEIFPCLGIKFVLISHNSDHGVSGKYSPFLASGKITEWYGQNVEFEHERLFSLPIGIANSQWSHGNLDLLDRIRNENNVKTIFVYKNFNVTPYGNRIAINAITNANGISMSPNKPQEDYLRDISKSVFCICPPGNGIDCHRVWECLYLNCIPVVHDHIHYRQFQDLPILLIKDWQTLTIPFLKEQAFIMSEKEYHYEKLDMSYWKDRIFKNGRE